MEILLKSKIKEAVDALYNCEVSNTPEKTGESIGNYLVENFSAISGFNVIKGFLNLEISDTWWIEYFRKMANEKSHLEQCQVADPETILVEYSSPNTNKPLHLGHIRNNLLGYSLFRILSACGHKVIKTNIVTSELKGDHLVGKYYVIFDKEYKTEISRLVSEGVEENEAKNSAPLMKEAREMLLKWEAGDKDVIDLWKMMNSWVYKGFDETYLKLGVDFDKIYYESDTYKIGKDIVLSALSEKILYQNEDSSIWADLTSDGLDQKLLLRSDGTAVYMTQDLGTAVDRYKEYNFNKNIYVVGNEQNYHFQVLKAILKRMGYGWSDGLVHFSYGMVDLPEGRMKSREGTIVDADDLIREMQETAKEVSLELGKLADFSDGEKEEIFRKIGLGALKYYILKVDPKKNMTFNPAESIDFNGNTGPFIQYTYTRIKSVFRKAEANGIYADISKLSEAKVGQKEIELIKLLRNFSATVTSAAVGYSPALIANYCYDLAREYNQFYHDFTILGESDDVVRNFRLLVSKLTSEVLAEGMWLLGIEMPERM